AMPRLANGPEFHLDQLNGRQLESLIGATEADSDELIEMLFIHLTGDENWHRVFLDAGIGFWETMSKADAFGDYENFRLVNLADRWHIKGSRISSATCIGGTWDDSRLSRFSFVTDVGTIVFEFVDSTDMDSDTVVRFWQAPESGS
ncbi:MAG: hypothetical protein U0941_30560, partial [Planctomycetaceae bacterium]